MSRASSVLFTLFTWTVLKCEPAASTGLVDAPITDDTIPTQSLTGPFTIFRKKLTWSEALVHCKNFHGHLAAFPTEEIGKETIEKLYDLSEKVSVEYIKGEKTAEFGPERRYWIGLTDLAAGEGKWTWMEIGQPLNYQGLWYTGQPDHVDEKGNYLGRPEHCVALWNPVYHKGNRRHSLVDVDCTHQYYFICQNTDKNPGKPTTVRPKTTTTTEASSSTTSSTMSPSGGGGINSVNADPPGNSGSRSFRIFKTGRALSQTLNTTQQRQERKVKKDPLYSIIKLASTLANIPKVRSMVNLTESGEKEIEAAEDYLNRIYGRHGVAGAGRGIEPLLIELSKSSAHISDGPLIAQVDDEEDGTPTGAKAPIAGRGISQAALENPTDSKKQVLTRIRGSQFRRKTNMSRILSQLKSEGLTTKPPHFLNRTIDPFKRKVNAPSLNGGDIHKGRGLLDRPAGKPGLMLSWPERSGFPPLWPEPKHPLLKVRKNPQARNFDENMEGPKSVEAEKAAMPEKTAVPEKATETEKPKKRKDRVVDKIIKLMEELKKEMEI